MLHYSSLVEELTLEGVQTDFWVGDDKVNTGLLETAQWKILLKLCEEYFVLCEVLVAEMEQQEPTVKFTNIRDLNINF